MDDIEQKLLMEDIAVVMKAYVQQEIAKLTSSPPEEVLRSPLAIARKHFSDENLKRPPSREELYTALEAVSDALHKMKARVAELEAADTYKGTYQRAIGYSRGAMVTHSSSLWIALKDVLQGVVPGTDPSCWQLASKGDKPVNQGTRK